ncbi:MAG TPA: hypothetical protein VK166_18585 [Chitinophagaceae bacterium]|nr:hypothetical protein [Chitinophagaceae bacterium]
MKRQPINKDNYEEYFLLYVDNELTTAEKAEVDAFIEKNPGLNAELQMFMGTKLDMEEVKMDGLEELYRYEERGLINENNFEEYQVLMIDNEIGQDERKALEIYNQSHPEAAANFEWLKKTRLPEEQIIFPDKNSLYRTEKKPATIISIRWISYAAAAAVILIAGLLWINGNEDEMVKNIEQPIAQAGGTADPRKDDSSKNTASVDQGDTNSAAIQEKTEITTGEAQTTNNSVAVTAKSSGTITRHTETKHAPAVPQQQPAVNESAGSNTQQIAALEKNETRISTEDLQAKKAEESLTPFVQPAVALNVKTNYATDALNGNGHEDEMEPLQEEGRQRKGLRGIVRKANRIYNKVTNPDLDKPLVKVANFEIGRPR